MENILHDFNEKVINLMTNFLKNSMEVGGLSEFTSNLEDDLMQLGYNLTKFSLEYAEDIIFKIKERKEQFESLEKDERNVISIFGEIDFKRRYYLDKQTGERVYLLDEYFKIAPKERLLENVETRLIEEAIETNYEKAGKNATYKTEISKQTVMNKISDLNINIDELKVLNKKIVDNIYIIADEDHVHLQKGGIEEPRLIVVYDSIIKDGKRTNLEWIPNSINVLDKFHLMKAINGIVGKENKENKLEISEYKRRIYRSFYELDFKKTKEVVYEIIAEEMEENTRKRKEKLLNYILNNKEGISNLYRYQKELHGCSAEGHISHLLFSKIK